MAEATDVVVATAAAVCRAGRVQIACAMIALRLKLVMMLLRGGLKRLEMNLKPRVDAEKKSRGYPNWAMSCEFSMR